jgi:hypothetical protein
MNERLQELAELATSRTETVDDYNLQTVIHTKFSKKKFAELIVQECKENFAKVWYEQGMDIRGAELDKFLTRFEEHFGVEE